MQRSRVATDNLVKFTRDNGIDILALQEPYTIHNKIVDIPKKYKLFAPGVGRSRAAILVTNNQIGTLLIKQLSDEDTILLEVLYDNVNIIYASMYLDITEQIENDLMKMRL